MENVRVLALFLHPLNSSRRENCTCQPLCTTFEGKGTPYNQIKQNAQEFQSFGINWILFQLDFGILILGLCITLIRM